MAQRSRSSSSSDRGADHHAGRRPWRAPSRWPRRERRPPPRWTVPGEGGGDARHQRGVHGLALPRAVEVDHVERRRRPRRRRRRAWATGSSLKTVDWSKSPWRRRTAWPVLEVDGGVERDHEGEDEPRRRTAGEPAASRPRPAALDFSGWNWTPSDARRAPRPRRTRTPWSARPSTSARVLGLAGEGVHEVVGRVGRRRPASGPSGASGRPVAPRLQPMWGSLRSVRRRRTGPGSRPRPGTPGLSSLSSNRSCRPRQMPSTGTPASAASRTAPSSPRARMRRMASPKWPDPRAARRRPRPPRRRARGPRARRRPAAPAPWWRCAGCSSRSRAPPTAGLTASPWSRARPTRAGWAPRRRPRARASALKLASMAWWALPGTIRRRCSVSPAWFASAAHELPEQLGLEAADHPVRAAARRWP